MARRKIIKIDEDKCDGCGLCVPACAEGAIQVIDGKARLVSEIYCDGLGDCLGECPRGALSVEEREAREFDQNAVDTHLAANTHKPKGDQRQKNEPLPCGCPGTLARAIEPAETPPHSADALSPGHTRSALRNWPVQVALTPESAPYFRNAELLIAADCAPFAFADFHRRFISGKTALVCCPKLDDAQAHMEKLAGIFKHNDIKSVEVAYMEVPCCSGLVRLTQDALAQSGKDTPLQLTKLGINGQILEAAPSPQSQKTHTLKEAEL